MFKAIASIYRLVFTELRPEFFGIATGALIVGLLEMLGVASIMPLIAVMIDPDALARNATVARLLSLAGLGTKTPQIHVIATLTIGLFIVANIAALALAYWSQSFASRLAVTLSERYALAVLHQPFSFFHGTSPAELSQRTCNDVGQVAGSGVLQLCFALVRAIQIGLILVALLAIAPAVTMAFFGLVASLYASVYRITSARMTKIGNTAVDSLGRAVHVANEMYGISREIILKDRSVYFVDRLCAPLRNYYHADARARILPLLPKYALEIVCVGLIFALPIYRSIMGQDARAELPLIATFAYAGFRLLPVAQQLYSCLTILHFHAPTADRLHAVIAAPSRLEASEQALSIMPERLSLDSVSYRYAGAEQQTLFDINLTVQRGERVAIVGPSGSGKSTLVDLLLGLLAPTAGTIEITHATGQPVDDRNSLGPQRRKQLTWDPRTIGYVPQLPLLLSDTIAANIAFGERNDSIDRARCQSAAAQAGIAHVLAQHPRGLDARIGSDIPDLSGGERQRLAIARALYAKPSLLVLDEPASALDPTTARRIFETLRAKDLEATVVVITHNLEYLDLFDKIVLVDAGRVVLAGAPDAVLKRSPEFTAFIGSIGQHRT